MKQDIIINPAYVKRTEEYHEQFHTHKFNKFDEMDQYPQKHKTNTIHQYKIHNLNNPTTTKEIKFVI